MKHQQEQNSIDPNNVKIVRCIKCSLHFIHIDKWIKVRKRVPYVCTEHDVPSFSKGCRNAASVFRQDVVLASTIFRGTYISEVVALPVKVPPISKSQELCRAVPVPGLAELC